MRNNIYRKGLVLGIIVLFVGAGVIPSMGGIVVEKKSFTGSNSRGYIQDLIDNASDGDTIYIPSGTYYENIVIDKSINLVGESKETTIIDGNNLSNVVEITADWVNISGFTIQNSGDEWYGAAGIEMGSNYNTITSNNISNNAHGIKLSHSSSNTITDNSISKNYWDSIKLRFSSSNTIEGNTILNNRWCGISLYESSSNTITGNNILYNGNVPYNGGGIYLGDSTSNIVTGNTILNNNYGILLLNSSGNNITDNNISNNNDSIQLVRLSDNNTFTGNTITSNNNYSIYLQDSSGNNINSNIISNNKWDGIYLHDSLANTITDNTITLNHLYGILLRGASNNTITDNKISLNSRDGIHFWDSSNNTIMGNNIISNNGAGIHFGESHNNIMGNIISNNRGDGIYISASDNNIITNNNISSNNGVGIRLRLSSNNNRIYHNDFINNTQNAYDECNNTWDKGYPSGGNFWDDYNGIDSDGDGIGDTPYPIPGGDNEDRYPLMEPYQDKIPPNVTIIKPERGFYFFNKKFLKRIFPPANIIGNITIEVNASDTDSGIEKVEFYINGVNMGNDTTKPYTYDWRWKRPRLFHLFIIKVVAYDYAGNTAIDRILVRKIL